MNVKYQKSPESFCFCSCRHWMNDSFMMETLCAKVWSCSRLIVCEAYFQKIQNVSLLYLNCAPPYLQIITVSCRSPPNNWQILHTTLSYVKCFFHNFKILEIGLKCRPWINHELYLNILKAPCTPCHTIQSNFLVFTGLNMGFDVTNQNSVKA